MNETHPVPEADLHAYADGLLEEADRKRVEAHLAENPDAARLSANRALAQKRKAAKAAKAAAEVSDK